MKLRPWRKGDGQVGGIIVMSEDITEIMQQRAIQENEARLSALGMMAGGVAHEINTPLQTISLNVAMLTDELNNSSPDLGFVKECASTVADTTKRIDRVVRGLRTVTRDPSKDELTPVLVNALVDDVTELCHARFRAHGVVFSVVDSGPGIPSENVDKLMSPFFTTKPLGKGTGLGLSISKTLAERSGGTLRFAPDADRTTFEFWIPVTDAAEVAA